MHKPVLCTTHWKYPETAKEAYGIDKCQKKEY